jgi:hypothetical protein
VSYETAAHRFTNLATRRLDVPVHFMRLASTGVSYKAYENDGVHFPTDATGAMRSRRTRSTPTPHRYVWCTAAVDRTPAGLFSVRVGVPYTQVKWMRGRETGERSTSRCSDPACCSVPPADLAIRWDGLVWPSARVHSHLLAAMPPRVFPGVDDTEVLKFLERHGGA